MTALLPPPLEALRAMERRPRVLGMVVEIALLRRENAVHRLLMVRCMSRGKMVAMSWEGNSLWRPLAFQLAMTPRRPIFLECLFAPHSCSLRVRDSFLGENLLI